MSLVLQSGAAGGAGLRRATYVRRAGALVLLNQCGGFLEQRPILGPPSLTYLAPRQIKCEGRHMSRHFTRVPSHSIVLSSPL